MTYGRECKVIRNENEIRCLEVTKVEAASRADILKKQNRELIGKQFKEYVKKVNIELVTTSENDYQTNYIGRCSCGCGKELYKGVTVISVRGYMVHIDCLSEFLKEHMVVLK